MKTIKMGKRAIYCFSLLFLFLTRCVSTQTINDTSGVENEELESIPKGSEVVIIKKDTSAKGLYSEIVDVVINRGHRIENEKKEKLYLITGGKDVGESTLQRMTIRVEQDSSKAKGTIRTEWNGGTEISYATGVDGSWMKAEWEINREGIAFGESVAIAREIENAEVTYK